MRLVVFHQGALGDFLLTIPILEGLHEICSGLQIDFWSKREHVSLLDGKNYLGEFHALEGRLLPSLFHDSLWMTFPLPTFLSEADQVIIFGQTGTRILADRLSVRLKARVNWIQSFPGPEDNETHVTNFILRQIRRLGWKAKGRFGNLAPNPHELEAVRTLLQDCGISSPPVLIHPGSGGKRKVWPLKNWHDLLHWIKNQLSIPVLLSVGPADEYLEDFSRMMAQAGIPVIGGLPLTRLAALLSGCSIFVGSDSGVSHLAAAVGVQTVVVFGPTDPGVWGPRGEKVRLVQRSWRESEIFEWEDSRSPEAPDREVTRAITELLKISRQFDQTLIKTM
jgi:heptosyltransferase III